MTIQWSGARGGCSSRGRARPRRPGLAAAALACAGWVCGSGASADEMAVPPRPNILLIMADDLGYETIGINGGESYSTPHLDALARSGIRFENAHSAPKGIPSRISLMTGRYTFRTNFRWKVLPPEETTFVEVLRSVGYATAVAGKWQLSRLKKNPRYPVEKGFDEYSLWAWHEGPRYYEPWIWQNGVLLKKEVRDRYGPDWYSRFLIDFMEKNRDRPFVAYYPMTLPHPPDEYEVSRAGGPKSYGQMVEYADGIVGHLIDALDRLGLREQTLVIFTADNGSPDFVQSKFRGRVVSGGKKTLGDAGTHVPFFASWPGTAPAGAVSAELIDFTDILPTLSELAGAPRPQGVVIDGRSFAPQLQGRSKIRRAWIFTEWKGKSWIRNARWKLYADGDFYDLESDPDEARRLGTDDLDEKGRAARRVLESALFDLRSGR
jgi:arylsulfatase A